MAQQSKFQHGFGQAVIKDLCYDDIHISLVTWKCSFSSVNASFDAIIVEYRRGDALLVLLLHEVSN
uniref:DUF1899 domain-containing protein n=1 Tax=Equus asinus TaxID=9793 RepID=A0A9L0KGM8_EQUAS